MNLPNGNPNKPRLGVYLLPNLFTTIALFCGFYAIVSSIRLNFEVAALAILIAMVFDALDGRIARMTRTESAFGAEYDSLADIVSFGVAPSLLVYQWVLHDLERLGLVSAFAYCAATALRLARFNSRLLAADKRFFQGLPSPAGAALLAGFVWVMIDRAVTVTPFIVWLTYFITIFAALSMISNLAYYSFKTIHFNKQLAFYSSAVGLVIVVLVSIHPPGILFAIVCVYALSGYVVSGYARIRHWKAFRRNH